MGPVVLMLIISESNKLQNERISCAVFFSLIDKAIYEAIIGLSKMNYAL